MRGRRGIRPIGRLAGIALASAALLVPATAEAFKVKTNRGGSCSVKPRTTVQGDQVTYGLNVRNCETRNGVQRVASEGFAIEGRQVVSTLPQKLAPPPYSNFTTSERTLPDDPGGGLLPDIPLVPDIPEPEVPPLPDLPLVPPLPVDVPSLPELPELPPLPGGGGDDGESGQTYTRLDYSLKLNRGQGRRARRKPERWRARDGCLITTAKRTDDTIVCQSFAPTS